MVLGVGISTGNKQAYLSELLRLACSDRGSYACLCNVHMLIEAHDSNDFKEVVNSADLVIPDGAPVAKAVHLLYGIKQDRLAGMDLMELLLSLAEKKGLRVLLYGGEQSVLDKILEKVAKDYPFIKGVKGISPPFRNLTEDEEGDIVAEISSFDPDLILVSLGCPKQEKWMFERKGVFPGCMIGLGGAFPVFSGDVSRAPNWMQACGLEWLYRFILDPRRLWKRYLYTNAKFIYLFLMQVIAKKLTR